MKKRLIFYLVFALLAINAWAQQNTTVTIGTGTVATSDYGPLLISNLSGGHFSQHAAIYKASEINATSFAGKVLTKIAWNKTDTSRYSGNNGVLKIYVKQTTATTIPAAWTGDVDVAGELIGATLVYSSSTQNISTGAGWKNFTLQTPFIWNGTSNLEVVVDWSVAGVNTGTTPMAWASTPVTTDLSAYFADAFQPGYIYLQPNRPNAQLTFTEFSNDAGISAITAPAAIITPGTSPVQATVKNFGSNLLTAATIGWKVNGVAQPDQTWAGSLTTGQTSSPNTLGNFNFPFGSSTVKAYIKTANGLPDPFHFNDTAAFKLVACNALSGNYTINKNAPASATNLRSFTEAAQVLNACGITGAVTFTVVPGSGPYNESVALTNVQGTSVTNTITFEGNGNTIISAAEAVFKLDRANYVKLNNLVITNTNIGTFSTTPKCVGVQLIGPSNFATVSNCTINMPMVFGDNIIGILIGNGPNFNTTGNYSSNSLFENNIINGGHYGMRITGLTVTGSSPTGAVTNRIAGNQFLNFNNYGIYLINADGTKIENNSFSRPTRTDVSNFNGVQVSVGCINTIINKNRFYNTHGGVVSPTTGISGIVVEAAAPAGSENIVKNNLFYNLNNISPITVLNVYNTATGLRIYHNTISIENPNRPATNSSALKAINIGGDGTNVKFVNNIVTINMPGTGKKTAIYLNVPTVATFVSNNNTVFLAPGQTNAYTGFLTSDRATMANWQAANTAAPYDVNSVAFNPAFVSLATGNLKPTSPDVNNTGQALATVTDDFMGATRSATTPDPGAYEFDLGTLDAGITAFTSLTTPTPPSVSTPVIVTIKNFGTAPLTTATIGWKVNGTAQPAFAWTGNLAANQTAAVTIGSYTFPAGSYSVCAWTKNPNGGIDVNAANDSTCTSGNACNQMAGNYTINKAVPNSATNFTSFTAAAERLHNCGVSAKVTITVAANSGPYTENVELLSIPGVSATNRVMFQGNGNVLTATPTVLKPNLLKLDNADFVKINNLTLELGGNPLTVHPTFSALQLVNNSDNDTISNCTISMQHNIYTSTVYVGILAGTDVSLAGNNTNNSVFTNNTISGGLYGIKINGNPTSGVNNKITGNTILDGMSYGIVLENTDGNLVDANLIKRPTLLNAAGFQAISLIGVNKNATISRNRINNLWGTYSGGVISNLIASGLYVSGIGAPAGSENKFVNNLIEDTNTPQYFYGVNIVGGSGNYFYHNTIISNQSGGFYGYKQSTAFSTNNRFNNNIIAVQSSDGALNNTAIQLDSDPTETNNNVIYFAPGITNKIFGFYTPTAYTTLATWKTANNNAFDQQSVEADPVFLNSGINNPVPANPLVNNIGKPLPAVTTDLLGNTRNAVTPDPGAYEFTPSPANTAVVAINSPVSNCGLSNQETVSVSIKNLSGVTAISVPVSFQVNGGAPVVETFTGNLAFNTTATYTFTAKANLSGPGAHRILAKTLLPGDTDLSNDTLSVKVVNAFQAGLPVAFNFETPATGISAMRLMVNKNAGISEGAAASNGTGSTKGMIMDGIDNPNWVLVSGSGSSWTINPENLASAYVCLATANTNPQDTLRMTFDLKQLYKLANVNTNFRVTVNGTQVGPTYRPPFNGGTPVWQKITVDLSSYLSQPFIQVGFESSVKEAYANGTGTANLIDNVQILRIAGPTGVKENALMQKVIVYPNPSTGLFNISLPTEKAFELTITDLTGKVIKKQTARNGASQLNLEGTAKGIYLLQVSGENGTAIRKLIVE